TNARIRVSCPSCPNTPRFSCRPPTLAERRPVVRDRCSAHALGARGGWVSIITMLCQLILALPAVAQSASGSRPNQNPQQNAISGQVIEAESGTPLRMAQVHLEPVGPASAPAANGETDSFVRGI